MASSITFDGGELQSRLERAGPRAQSYLADVTHLWTARMERDAKIQAPWTDRTGNARNGLFAEPIVDHPVYGVILAHSVNYGIWLEVRFGERFAVIMPVLQRDGQGYMADAAQVLGAI